MAIIIQRTNPDYVADSATWRCASCRGIHATEKLARECAVADHARNNKARKEAGR